MTEEYRFECVNCNSRHFKYRTTTHDFRCRECGTVMKPGERIDKMAERRERLAERHESWPAWMGEP
jgi:uncharacterized Zn finger protein